MYTAGDEEDVMVMGIVQGLSNLDKIGSLLACLVGGWVGVRLCF